MTKMTWITTSNKALERALVELYGASDEVRGGALGARLDFLKRLGVAGPIKGKGAGATYTPDQADRLGLALELEEFGFGPADIAALFEVRWRWIAETLTRARA